MKYRKEIEGGNGWTRWITPRAPYRIKCCDCALVHNLQTRVSKGRIQFRVKRIGRRKTSGK